MEVNLAQSRQGAKKTGLAALRLCASVGFLDPHSSIFYPRRFMLR